MMPCMSKNKLESEFVRLVMPDASEAEIEEATRRWFGFLGTIHQMVERLERAAADSHAAGDNDRVRSD